MNSASFHTRLGCLLAGTVLGAAFLFGQACGSAKSCGPASCLGCCDSAAPVIANSSRRVRVMTFYSTRRPVESGIGQMFRYLSLRLQ